MVMKTPAANQKSMALNAQILESNQPAQRESQLRSPDGRTTWSRWYKVPFTQANGRCAVFTLISDITAEKQVAANRELLRKVLDQTTDLIHVRDSAGNFILANRALATLLGAPKRIWSALQPNFANVGLRPNGPATPRINSCWRVASRPRVSMSSRKTMAPWAT
ncbi:MAG: PAS domain-containing protein [Caldilineaceae bacterium]